MDSYKESLKFLSEYRDRAKSESAKFYYSLVDMLSMNYKLIYPIGKREVCTTMNMDEEARNSFDRVVDHIHYSAMYNMSFSILEYFNCSFFIEKINKESIKTRADAERYLKRKYGYKLISFQNLRQVSKYYSDELDINLKNFDMLDFITDILIKDRHNSAHSIGIINDQQFIQMELWNLNIVIPMQIFLVDYIDEHFVVNM